MAGALGTTRPWRPARGKIEKPGLPGRSCSRENKEDFVVEEDYPPKSLALSSSMVPRGRYPRLYRMLGPTGC